MINFNQSLSNRIPNRFSGSGIFSSSSLDYSENAEWIRDYTPDQQSLIHALKLNKQDAFSNSPIDPLLAWYDAADTSSIIQSSGRVSQWSDKSGNGKHATQGTVVEQPLALDRYFNGKNTILFDKNIDGTLEYLDIASIQLTQNLTIFAVVQNSTQTAGGSIHRSYFVSQTNPYVTGNTGYGFGLKREGSNGVYNQIPSNASNVAIQNSAVADQLLHIYTTVNDNNSVESFVDNSSIGTISSDRTTGFNSAYRIGADATFASREYSGSICEIIVYNRALSSLERTQINSYLVNKWGVV
jgi:hypothetical protein